MSEAAGPGPAPAWRFARLGPAEALPFVDQTFPAYRHDLIEPASIVLGAYLGDRPVGLALARPEGHEGRAELLSLFVVPDMRGQGLGTALLAHLEGVLAAAGFRLMRGVYTTGKPSIPALEHILAKQRWLPPSPRMMVFRADLTAMDRAPLLNRGDASALEPPFEITRWVDRDPDEVAALKAEQAAHPWIPGGLEPWRHDVDCEEETSLALRHDGKLVGWVLTHRLSPELLRFSSGWVHPDHQRRGRLLPLYWESGRRALAQGYREASWTVPLQHEAKAAFARRWLAPMATRVDESRESAKWLAPGGLVAQEDDDA